MLMVMGFGAIVFALIVNRGIASDGLVAMRALNDFFCVGLRCWFLGGIGDECFCFNSRLLGFVVAPIGLLIIIG